MHTVELAYFSEDADDDQWRVIVDGRLVTTLANEEAVDAIGDLAESLGAKVVRRQATNEEKPPNPEGSSG